MLTLTHSVSFSHPRPALDLCTLGLTVGIKTKCSHSGGGLRDGGMVRDGSRLLALLWILKHLDLVTPPGGVKY